MASPITPQTAPLLLTGVVIQRYADSYSSGQLVSSAKVARFSGKVLLRNYFKTTHVFPKEPFGSAQDKLRD
jgi:hypothetical protein